MINPRQFCLHLVKPSKWFNRSIITSDAAVAEAAWVIPPFNVCETCKIILRADKVVA